MTGKVAGAWLSVQAVPANLIAACIIENHYLHRRPPISYAFGLYCRGDLVGVATFGTPPSRHLQISLCPSDPSKAIELNRVWVSDSRPKNTETFFIGACLRLLPPFIVCSYADTAVGHTGYIYRAGNWNYAGMTDADRKTPRYDYVPNNGKHSRDAFRSGEYTKVRRKPKHRYWTVTGNPTMKRKMKRLCKWPVMSWKNLQSSADLRPVVTSDDRR
jgi:hypothetical protein